MKKEVDFQVKMKPFYMYDFLLHHAYRGMQGVIGIIVTAVGLALLCFGFGRGDTTATVLLTLMTCMFPVINPIYLYYKAFKQVKLNKIFQEPLHYIVNDEGITIQQGTEEAVIPWTEVGNVIETKTSVIIYLSRIIGYIFPKKCLGEDCEMFKELIKEHVEKANCKLK